jgi:hypothetical protein
MAATYRVDITGTLVAPTPRLERMSPPASFRTLPRIGL